jgi:hypothetical protein
LLVPVAGPFIEIGRANGSALAITFLLIDGLGQTAGAAMAIAGVAWPKVVLRRNDLGSVDKKTTVATIEPFVGAQSGLKITF